MSLFDRNFMQYSKKKVKAENKNLALYLTLHSLLYIVLLFLLIFFIWYTAFVTTHKYYEVSGVSMKPTINTNAQKETDSFDAVYVNLYAPLKVFDVVVVNNPKSVIKRLMALEGDYITIAKAEDGNFYFHRIEKAKVPEEVSDEQSKLIEDGRNGYSISGYDKWNEHTATGVKSLTVGGQNKSQIYEENFYNTFLDEFYVARQADENLQSEDFYVSSEGLMYVRVPKGKVFYLGDNRAQSTDCRERGFCDRSKVVGNVEIVVENYNFVNRLAEVVNFYFGEMRNFFAR